MSNRIVEKSIRLCWLLAMVCLVAISVEAAPVDAATAQSRASQCVKSRAAGRMMPATATVKLAHALPSTALNGASDYYVFDIGNDEGFVIVAGDDRAEQVLAWGDGAIDMNNLPCGLAWMLDQYREQMEWLIANPSVEVETPRQLLSSDGEPVAVAPMLTCTWGQSEPFYNQCPMYNGERCVTGCVATAMAQVMYYWKYPEMAPALSGYWVSGISTQLPNLQPKRLNWDQMIDSYAQGYTPEQGEAVATLMRYCGQSCHMSYHPDGSGAYVDWQLRGMRSFGYSSEASMLNRPNYSYEEWDALLKQDLTAGRPVLYAANDPNAGGHAFVLDGYYDGKYHVNWGWNNTGNGYFVLDAFIVRDYFFGANQQMLHKIHPNTEPTIQSNHDFELDGIYYRYDEQHTSLIVTNRDTKYASYSGSVSVPSQVVVDGVTMPVTAIGDQAFRNCYDLTGIELPEGVVSIGRQAFINCVALPQVAIPSTVKSIGELAFQDCIGLTRVETPSIDSWLDIKFVDHYANPLSYAHHLFAAGEEVKDLVVDRYVNPFAFTECHSLESLTISDGVTEMGAAAFSYCTGIKQLHLPGNMKSVAKQAFYECTGLKTLTIPEGVETLDNSSFSSCTSLTSISLPQSLTTIGSSAFKGCKSLACAVFPDGIETIGNSAFSGCGALESISLPEGLVSLGDGAFQSCSALTSVTLPDGVEVIGNHAFEKCAQLTKVVLGSGLKSIGDDAFSACQLIATVKSRAITPPTLASSQCFYLNIYRKAKLYVPYEALDSYKHSFVWPWFTSMIGTDVDHEQGDVNGDGEITVADINAVIDAILNTPDRSYRFDVNYDGEINIADINAVIDLILEVSN